MQAIILAAGMGHRLGEYTKDNTKCMISINGIKLIDRFLKKLSCMNLSRVIIVVGYKSENVIDYIGSRYDNKLKIEFINNPIYEKTNNIYSLSLAKEQMMEDDTLLLESDLIVDDRMFDLLIDDEYPNLALVAKYEAWMDGTMVCLDQDNNIVNFVPKSAFRYEDIGSYYKTVNIYKFSKEFCKKRYIPFLEAYVKALGDNEYYEQVLRVITLINIEELKAKPIGDLPWYEIDDVQDKDIAETIFADEKDKLSKYMKRYGGYWRFENMLDFCYLVNPYFPPQKMLDELQANFSRLLTEYPSGMFVNSLLAGRYFNIKQDYVVVGNGAAELIKSLMERETGKTGMIYPTFEEYPHRKNMENIVSFLPKNKDLRYTIQDLMLFYDDKNINSILLINPDNPSGNFIEVDEILFFLKWCKRKCITLILDESFVDFSENWKSNSLLHNDILEQYDNLVVVKSISKSYGVPGLRLGVLASSNVKFINSIKKDISIWNINSFAEFYMQIFNKYDEDYKSACDKLVVERFRFIERLKEISYLRVIPSQANFVMCEVDSKRFSSLELTEILLSKYNILIKNCDTKVGLKGKNMIRIAIRNSNDNDMLIDILKKL
ncbi:aminotransferase class I/II-fold pyridoxal phosphate-dependent enzyme [Parabacteroides distasonis]|uniref:Aminotransferase n=1 Tax=Parabacteroides distasonis TaxID=823 RepID=A0A173RWA0_PARDI|nr:aminotransferase class I/II-fold pyridoxal phosphate-dependent enzyme [Parabacteroides distasonis]CDB50596.1 hemolysin erythrocyte lysis protein [Parabacteroides sp. CAG:2]CUM81829.1 Threonine-phosphate decarboxylase [Parabacteroides distasonis]